MSDIRLSILVPSISRPSLAATLASIQSAGFDSLHDEVIVIGDGQQPEAAKMVDGCWPGIRYVDGPLDHCWGHPQRNAANLQAKGTHLLSIDDDDVYRPDALNIVREQIRKHPDRVLLFRMNTVNLWDGKCPLVWRGKELRQGNIGTPCSVVPNIPGKVGKYGRRYEGDWDFICETRMLRGDDPVWCPQIIADIKPKPLPC